MTRFDPIATPAASSAEHLEPAFAHAEQAAAAKEKLAAYVKRRGRLPNFLVFLMDDVGWGDFGCYGGGAAGRRADADVRPGRCARPAADVVLFRAHLLAFARDAADRKAAAPPRAAPPADVRRARRPAGRSHDRAAALGLRIRDAGGRQVACRENEASQPQNVGFDDFYGFLSVSDMYTEWRDPHFFPEIVYSDARTDWVKNMPFNRCFVHAKKGGATENVEEVTIPVLSLLDDKWCAYSTGFLQRMAKERKPWLLYHCTRGAHFDNYPHPSFLGASPARHPYKDTLIELDDILRRLTEALLRDGTGRRHADSSSHRTTARTWRRGPTRRTRRFAARRARPGKAACACRASSAGRE
jgi:arylsulfatase